MWKNILWQNNKKESMKYIYSKNDHTYGDPHWFQADYSLYFFWGSIQADYFILIKEENWW